MGKTPNLTITRADWHVLGYGTLSGFGYGLWLTHSLTASIFFGVCGILISVTNVIISKMAVGPFFFRLSRSLENLIRLAIAAVPAYFLVRGVLNREWDFVILIAWWFFVPLVYLLWQGGISRIADDRSRSQNAQASPK